jgi:[ribosomal protein S5]-alanine N-acetyltransferase
VYPVKLVGPRITLREFRRDDIDEVLTLVGDDRVTRWLSFDSRTREQAVAMIDGVIERAQQQPRVEYYLAAIRESDSIIGFARLGLDGVQAAKLGYAIAADFWGQGYASEAARLAIDFGFRDLQLHRISAAIGPDNAPSISVVRRLGMVYEGRIRDHVFTNGNWRDSELYSILTHEWRT